MKGVRQELGREGFVVLMKSDLLVIIYLSVWNGVHGRGVCIEGEG